MKRLILIITIGFTVILTACDETNNGTDPCLDLPQGTYDIAPTPQDIPTINVNDAFATTCYETSFAKRRQDFIDLVARNRSRNTYSELMRMKAGNMPDEQKIREDLDFINGRNDCSDFRLHAVIRMLYQFKDSGMLSDGILHYAEDTVLSFKYWPDEPGIDSMCYWSENHFILFASGAYLTGQLFPDDQFYNSCETGQKKMERFKPRIMRWLTLRYQAGFSEWLSNVYYDEDIAPLVNLVDFCQDQEISRLAAMVLDLIMADMALNQFQGTFGSTHGRSYENDKMSGWSDNTGSTFKLMFGLNRFDPGNMSSTNLALSDRYRMPSVIFKMANDRNRDVFENRQRMSFKIEEAGKWGLDYDELEDGMTFLTMEAYTHPLTINLFRRMLDAYSWWENDFFKPFADNRDLIETVDAAGGLPLLATVLEKDLTRNLRPEVNIDTFRTPDYMLSTAQDWRRGYGGDQQSIWQATLGTDAVCFVTHPASDRHGGDTPNYWTGYGTMPRSVQVRNVVISLFFISSMPGLYITNELFYTHAYLPTGHFDEVIEEDGWIFARKGNGYMALWSREPYEWIQNDDDPDRGGVYEIIADGKENVWICELGNKSEYGSFAVFIEQITASKPISLGLCVVYDSPSQGLLKLGWIGPMYQNMKALDVGDFARYNNPYGTSDYPGNAIDFTFAGKWLRLNLETGTREANFYVE